MDHMPASWIGNSRIKGLSASSRARGALSGGGTIGTPDLVPRHQPSTPKVLKLISRPTLLRPFQDGLFDLFANPLPSRAVESLAGFDGSDLPASPPHTTPTYLPRHPPPD